MIRNNFKFNAVQSKSYNVFLSGSGIYDSPARAYEAIKIPGRSGDLLMPENRLDNVDIVYPCYIADDFDTNFNNFKSAMLAQIGYRKLEDTYDSTHYRQACFSGGLKPKMQRNLKAGTFNVTFNCKPQRWLKSGDTAITVNTSGTTVTNPTRQKAKPILTITGSGTVTIGGVTLTIALPTGTTRIIIDCETSEASHPTIAAINMNQYVTSSSINFPELSAGNNSIVFASGVSSVEIVPRWYDL